MRRDSKLSSSTCIMHFSALYYEYDMKVSSILTEGDMHDEPIWAEYHSSSTQVGSSVDSSLSLALAKILVCLETNPTWPVPQYNYQYSQVGRYFSGGGRRISSLARLS